VPGVEFEHFLDGGGQAAAIIRSIDWNATALGPIGHWPASLRTAASMVLASKFPQCIFWGPDLIGIYNDAFRPILGTKPEAMGQPMRTVWAEVWGDIRPIAERALDGESTFIEDYSLVIHRRGYPEQTNFTFSYSPIRDEIGTVVGLLDTVIETTAKVQAEKNAYVLNGELAHRIKNTLTMVTAIAHQTYRSAASRDDMYSKLNQRIVALSRAHEILTHSSWSGAAIHAVIEGSLSPLLHDSDCVQIDGPPLNLSAQQSLALALAIHELGTNAIKYGALSVDGGYVRIRWQIGEPDSAEQFRFEWREFNGPVVATPCSIGFGSRLIRSVLAEDFRGQVEIYHEPGGLRCVLTTTMSNLMIVGEKQPA